MCDKEFGDLSSHSGDEFQQSSKKPRISESMVGSSAARMWNSSTSWSRKTRPTRDYSQPCLKFRRGYCNFGDRCIYSHGETRDAARMSLYTGGGTVAEEKFGSIDKPCRFFMLGKSCPFGYSCQFSHQDNAVVHSLEGGENKGGFDEVRSQRIENLSFKNSNQMQPNHLLWRTKLCRQWERFMSCPYGLECHYAHGESELRRLGSLHQLESGKSFIKDNVPGDPVRTSLLEQKEKSKRHIKLDSLRKINGIYADWIESMPMRP